MKCPHCKGDGCDPGDHGTAIVADCPVCDGVGNIAEFVRDAYLTGLREGWRWEYFFQVIKEPKR